MLNVCDKTIDCFCFLDILYWNRYPIACWFNSSTLNCLSFFLVFCLFPWKWKGGLFPYLISCLLCTFHQYDRLWIPSLFQCGLFYQSGTRFPSFTPWLILVPWSIPSQLRFFHVNGVLIAPVHELWKRGLLWWSTIMEQSCLNDNIRAVTLILLSLFLCLSMYLCLKFSLSLAFFVS